MKTKLSLLAGLLLAGCAVGPSYRPPEIPKAAGGPLLGATASPSVTPAVVEAGEWWRLYQDPVLDSLVADALAANTDLRVAIAHLEKARASLRLARSDRLPTTTIQAGGNYQRVPEMLAVPGQEREGWQVSGGLTMSYELDLFGRVTRSIQSAHRDADAVAADADAVRVSVVADTIRAYVDAATAAEQLAAARRNVDLLDQSLKVTTRRFEAGRAARVDVLRIEALRQQEAAHVPDIEAARQAALYRLATLTGRAPAELPAAAGERATPPTIDQPLPVGDGAALLARRPDVRAAERRLAAATARIGVATAELYPRISLGGSIGQTGSGFGHLFGGGALSFLTGPLISWNFPNIVAARAKIAGARADTKASLASFDGTVLKALEETETALTAYAKALDKRAIVRAEVEQADAAARVVRNRQKEGTVDYLTVIDAERTAASAAADLALADGRVASAQVDLFKALGGGWRSDKNETRVADAR
ncbi:efflux transporter outer membrane subunit [Sphingomonas sp. PR090111-T3T-6A]|uniref:efflux transporter outer membrane subunit n=1 Tax=Sphingomonas sp. PR090111-T3T-6A TaxID=685778 RepID=UPI000382BDC2|nr:efflux transporter outer membrane subunit [Sphingomonas sp. PR090111-T3T-6A]